MKTKEYSYKGYDVIFRYRQWYSNTFEGSFATISEFKRYINARIGRGNLKDLSK